MNLRIIYKSKKKRFIPSRSKLIPVSLLLILFFSIGPIIADQVNGNSVQQSIPETSTLESGTTPYPVDSNTVFLIETDSNTLFSDEPDSSSASSQELSKSEQVPALIRIPPHAVSDQDMHIQMPRVQRIDPRASQTKLPKINFEVKGSEYLMICIRASKGLIDVDSKGVDNSSNGIDFYLSGDMSSSLRMSGLKNQMLDTFNSNGGLQIRETTGKSVAGSSLRLSFVAISEPTDNFSICSQSENSNVWTLEIKPLELQISTRKNTVNLGNK